MKNIFFSILDSCSLLYVSALAKGCNFTSSVDVDPAPVLYEGGCSDWLKAILLLDAADFIWCDSGKNNIN